MIEKIKNVSNPLTIIAIFAGLAEISSTIAIGLLSLENQKIFLWFIMLFPSLLVLLFFLTLFLKSHLFYAPKDFRTDDAYIQIHQKLHDARASSSFLESKLSIQQLSNNSDKLLEVAKHLPTAIKKYLVLVVDKELSFAEHTSYLSSFLEVLDRKASNEVIDKLSDNMTTIGYWTCFAENYLNYLFVLEKGIDNKMILKIPQNILEEIKK